MRVSRFLFSASLFVAVLALLANMAVIVAPVDAQSGAIARIFGTGDNGRPQPLFASADGVLNGSTLRAAISGSTIATAQLITPATAGTRQVIVTGLVLTSAGTTTVTLSSGTGATCATGTPVTLAGPFQLVAGSEVEVAFPLPATTAGHGICWANSAAIAVGGVLTARLN